MKDINAKSASQKIYASHLELIKFKQIQAGALAKDTVNLTVNRTYYHFTGCADYRPVQMTSEDFTFFIACTHMYVGIKLPVHRIYGACKRNYFVASLKFMGMIFFQ